MVVLLRPGLLQQPLGRGAVPGCLGRGGRGHQRAASARAWGLQEAANQATDRCASRPYCVWGWLPSGAGSGRNAPAAVSSAQSGGSSRPFWVRLRVRLTAPAAMARHSARPVSCASPSMAVRDQ